MKNLGLCLILILLAAACAPAEGYKSVTSELERSGNRISPGPTTTSTTSSTSTTRNQSTTTTTRSTGSSTTSTTLAPGPSTGDLCVGTGTSCRWQGPFISTPNEPARYIRFAGVDNGTYRRAAVKLDVKITGFTPSPSTRDHQGFHMLFWLTLNKRHNDLVGFSALKGNKDLMLRHGIDLGAGDKTKETQKFKTLVLGQTYRVEYVWDGGAGRAEMLVKDSTGKVLMTFNKYPPTTAAFQIRSNDIIGVGLSDHYGAVEVPSYGWEYSNLSLEVNP